MAASGVKSSGLSKAFGKTLVTTVGVTAVGFFSSVITTRILGPEGRGLLSAALLICTLSASVAQAGMANSYVYHHGASRGFRYLSLFLWSLLLVGLGATLLAWGGLQLNHDPNLHRYQFLILIFSGVMAAQMYFSSLSQLRSNLHFFNIQRFGLVLGNLVMLFPLLAWFRPVEYQYVLVIQLLVLLALVLLGAYWAMKHAIWRLPIQAAEVRLTSVLGYGINQHGTTMLSLFLLNFDKLVLLTRGNVVEYGYYSLAFTTSRLVGAVQDAVSVALFARFAGRDADRLNDAVNTAFRMTFLPLLGVAAIGALVAPWFLVLVYGKAFAAVASPFAILLFECVIGGASWTLAQRFNASGRPGLILARQFVSILPIFVAVPFLPTENTFVYLALLMLCGACLRLIMTLVLYVFKLKEPLPTFVPTRGDFQMIKQVLRR